MIDFKTLMSKAKKCRRRYIEPGSKQSTVQEGLITSYDFEKCKNYLMRKFPYITRINASMLHPLTGMPVPTDISTHLYYVTLGDNFERYTEVKDVIYNLCGWYVPKITLYFGGNVGVKYMDFTNIDGVFISESSPGMPDDVCFYLNEIIDNAISIGLKIHRMDMLCQEKYTIKTNVPDVLYHGTRDIHIDKVIKYGLLPKSKTNRPKRVYFAETRRIIALIFTSNMRPVYLRVNIKNKDKKNFYVDFNHAGCYYTEDCIPPSDIEVLIDLENDVWIPLKDFPETEKYKEIKERIEKETISFVK